MPIMQTFCRATCLLLLAASPVNASVDNLTIEGNEASAEIVLPGGVAAELALRFDSAVGLSAASLGLSAELVDPLSPAVRALLPSPAEQSLPAAFPVLLTIAAPADGGLAFAGVVEIELYTRNLVYAPGTSLRLLSSSDGEAFRDITDAVAGGSYRVRGSSGQFSTFLIVADERPLAAVIEAKFARLDALLAGHTGAMDPVVAGNLNLLAGTAYTLWQAGDPGAAIAELRRLGDAAAGAAAAGLLPGVWQSSRDVDNVAGALRATARTLAFSLGLALPEVP